MLQFRFATTVVLASFLSLCAGAQVVTFTGDVAADFQSSTYFGDPVGDVGIPSNFPSGAVSGWDLAGVGLSYDFGTDTLFIGFDSAGIFGDADGDGDPGSSSPPLLTNGGLDQPDLGGTESFTLALDLSNNGVADVIIGVGALTGNITSFQVAQFQGSLFAPFFAFGAPLPLNPGSVFVNPSAQAPDIEFTITNFSSLALPFMQMGQRFIGIQAFAGSLDDDGIGEDFLPGTGQLLPFPNPLLAKIGDFVWEDGDCDGVQGATEPGIGGVTVEIFDAANLFVPMDSTTTDMAGRYQFAVEAGTYVVRFPTQLSGFNLTSPFQGGDPLRDSDALLGTGFTNPVTVAAGEINDTLDAGYCPCPGLSALAVSLGTGCGLALDPVLSATPPVIGSTFTITVESTFPQAAVFFFYSLAPVTPMLVPGFPCTAYVSFLDPANFFMLPVDVTDATGDWELTGALNNNPSIIGVEIVCQARLCAPNGPVGPLFPDWASNGLLLRIGCP